MEQYIQPFVEVCSSIFNNMLHSDIVPGRAYFVNKEAFLKWDVSAVIALTGEVKGLVCISMLAPTAAKLANKMAGCEVPPEDIDDAIGEMVNIIAGNAKKKLEDMFRIIISLPKVVRGKAHFIVIPDERTRLLSIPFTVFDNETICLSINID